MRSDFPAPDDARWLVHQLVTRRPDGVVEVTERAAGLPFGSAVGVEEAR